MESRLSMSKARIFFLAIGLASAAYGFYSLTQFRLYRPSNFDIFAFLPFGVSCILGSLSKRLLALVGPILVVLGIYTFFHGSDLFGYWSEVGEFEGWVLGLANFIAGIILTVVGLKPSTRNLPPNPTST